MPPVETVETKSEDAPKPKKRISATKKRTSRKKSLDLSCPMMTMNKPANVIQNKEKRWLKGQSLPSAAINMHASFTALSMHDGKEDEDHDHKLMSKSLSHLMFEDGSHHGQDEEEVTETEEESSLMSN